jgi:hypothetical protein
VRELDCVISQQRMAAACAGSLKVQPPFLPHVLGLPPASHTRFHSSSDSDGGDEGSDEGSNDEGSDEGSNDEERLIRERRLEHTVGCNMAVVAATAAEALNSSQRTALERFCNARTGALQLVQGPPGCGKTMLVVAVLHALQARGLRVLLCAPSNQVYCSILCVCVCVCVCVCGGHSVTHHDAWV